MITAPYKATVIVGGTDQTKTFKALPKEIINRQSGDLTLIYEDPTAQPFDISSLTGSDFKCVPFDSGEVPTTLAAGVTSFTGEISTITAAAIPATGGTFTITVAEEETTALVYNATAAIIQTALEALASRSGGDFVVTALGAANLGEVGASVEIETSGGFAINFNSTIDTSSLTGSVHTIAVSQDGSNVENNYSVSWPKDTIPASYSEFAFDRDGSIAFFVALEDVDDFYQAYQRVSVVDDAFTGSGGSVPSAATFVYNPSDNNNWLRYATSSPVLLNEALDKVVDRNFRDFGAVIDRLATPPGSPADGDAYLVIATATGAWLSKENKIGKYSSTTTVWTFSNVHKEGDEVLDLASGEAYRYDGADFIVSSPAIGSGTVTNAQLANMNQDTIKGRISTGSGDPEDLTATQAKTVIGLDLVDNIADADKPVSTPQQTALDLKLDSADVTVAQFNADALQGKSISSATPSNGDVLAFNSGGNEYAPVAPGGGGGTNGGIAFQNNFETDITASEPATGGIKFNSATIGSVTIIRVSATDANAIDINSDLSTIGSGDTFYTRVLNDTTKFLKVSVTSSTFVTTSYDIVCTIISAGVLPAGSDIMGISPRIITIGGATGVSTWNGRAGAVVPASGDYTSATVTDSGSTVGGPTTLDSLNTLNTTKISSSRSVLTGPTLTGGGDLSADRTLDIDLTNANIYTAQQVFSNGNLTDAASIAWNLEDFQSTAVTLTDNRALANPTNQIDKGTYVLRVVQDGTGSRTLSFGANYKFSGGIAPTLTTTAGAVDLLSFVSDGTNMYGVFQGDFS